jgi:hypothetical protein
MAMLTSLRFIAGKIKDRNSIKMGICMTSKDCLLARGPGKPGKFQLSY